MYVHTCTQAGSSMLTLKLWKLVWNIPCPSAHSEVGSIDACLCQDFWTYCYHMGMSSPYWPLMNTDLLSAQLYCVKCFLSWTCCCYFMFMTTMICRHHICYEGSCTSVQKRQTLFTNRRLHTSTSEGPDAICTPDWKSMIAEPLHVPDTMTWLTPLGRISDGILKLVLSVSDMSVLKHPYLRQESFTPENR